ncbi:hypothetical protein [Pleomorphomonas koreensis]|uniref:hypothetical protein n=1 Tax=Pleomorphomonas koreensis TaxID=257440 RepID=UPI0012EB736B|nr:hypothetical protein [Pleomorphomonas koreensis]
MSETPYLSDKRPRTSKFAFWSGGNWRRKVVYASSLDDRKYVQVFSFPNMGAARAKTQTLSYRTDAYETPNGWVAVTLASKFTDDEAKAALQNKKKETGFPNDAFGTFGNTYKRKLCCD